MKTKRNISPSRAKGKLGHLSLRERKALKSLREKLLKALPGRIKGLILFGSKARGDDRVESDIDVLVLVDALDWKTRNQIYDLAIDVEEAHDYAYLLSTLIWDEAHFDQLLRHERRIALDIQKEGIPLYDPGKSGIRHSKRV